MTDETVTLGELAKRLGVSAQYTHLHPEIKEWLAEQKDVVFESRRSSIPAHLVEEVRERFKIRPSAPRKSRSAEVGDRSSTSVSDLLALRTEAEKAVEQAREAYTGAKADLASINRQIKQAEAEAEKRIADAEALVEQARADREALLALTK